MQYMHLLKQLSDIVDKFKASNNQTPPCMPRQENIVLGTLL